VTKELNFSCLNLIILFGILRTKSDQTLVWWNQTGPKAKRTGAIAAEIDRHRPKQQKLFDLWNMELTD
jgi:hypothetical protein